MKKSPRKLELRTNTVVQLDAKALEIVVGGGRSRTGNCPVYNHSDYCGER